MNKLILILLLVVICGVNCELHLIGEKACKGFSYTVRADNVAKNDGFYVFIKNKMANPNDWDKLKGSLPVTTTSASYQQYKLYEGIDQRDAALHLQSAPYPTADEIAIAQCRETGYSILNGVRNAPIKCSSILFIKLSPIDDPYCAKKFPLRVTRLPLNQVFHVHVIKDYVVVLSELIINKLNIEFSILGDFRTSDESKAVTKIVLKTPASKESNLSAKLSSDQPHFSYGGYVKIGIEIPKSETIATVTITRDQSTKKGSENDASKVVVTVNAAFFEKIKIKWPSGEAFDSANLSLLKSVAGDSLAGKIKGALQPILDQFLKSLSGALAMNPCYQKEWLARIMKDHSHDELKLELGFDALSQILTIAFENDLLKTLIHHSRRDKLSLEFGVNGGYTAKQPYQPKAELNVNVATEVIDNLLASVGNADIKRDTTILEQRLSHLITALGQIFGDPSFIQHALTTGESNPFWKFKRIERGVASQIGSSLLSSILHSESTDYESESSYESPILPYNLADLQCLDLQLQASKHAMKGSDEQLEDKFLLNVMKKADEDKKKDMKKIQTAKQKVKAALKPSKFIEIESVLTRMIRSNIKKEGKLWRFSLFDGTPIDTGVPLLKLYVRRIMFRKFGFNFDFFHGDHSFGMKVKTRKSNRECTNNCAGIKLLIYVSSNEPSVGSRDSLDDTSLVTITLPPDIPLFDCNVAVKDLANANDPIPHLETKMAIDMKQFAKKLDVDFTANGGKGAGFNVMKHLTQLGVNGAIYVFQNYVTTAITDNVKSMSGYLLSHPCIQKNIVSDHSFKAFSFDLLFARDGFRFHWDFGRNLDEVLTNVILGGRLRKNGIAGRLGYGKPNELLFQLNANEPDTNSFMAYMFSSFVNRLISNWGEIQDKSVVRSISTVANAFSELQHRSTQAAKDYFSGKSKTSWELANIRHKKEYLNRDCKLRYWESYTMSLENQIKEAKANKKIEHAIEVDYISGEPITDAAKLQLQLETANIRKHVDEIRLQQLSRVEQLLQSSKTRQKHVEKLSELEQRIKDAKAVLQPEEAKIEAKISKLRDIENKKRTWNPFRAISRWWKKRKLRKAIARSKTRLNELLALAGQKSSKELDQLAVKEQHIVEDYEERKRQLEEGKKELKRAQQKAHQ